MESPPMCYKHNRPFELLGNDPKCELNCQICCQCLRGVDHGHKKEIINHETVGMEQLSYHFDSIYKSNILGITECKEAIEKYFRQLQAALRDELIKEKSRMHKLANRIMLTDICKEEKQLATVTSLYMKDFSNIKCKEVGEISHQLFAYSPKQNQVGFKKFAQHMSLKQGSLSEQIKKLLGSKEFSNLTLKSCEEDIMFPDFCPKDEISKSEKESPKKTIRRSPKKDNDFNIQIRKPVEFTESRLVTNKQENSFMLRLFDHRKIASVRLLYRASQSNFSIKSFHQSCDNHPDTLVFAMTEFNKVIGGYTPIPWRSTANTLHSDVKNQSFLFSLSLKQKMALVDQNSAVFNSVNSGPTFGAGADLAIFNNANTQKTSYSEFPYSYANNRYKESNQHSTTLFTGQKSGNHFLLKEWEVWKVEFYQ